MGPLFTLKEDLSLWICDIPYSSHYEYEKPKRSACSSFPIFSSDII